MFTCLLFVCLVIFLLKTGHQIPLPLDFVVLAGILFCFVFVCFFSDFPGLILQSLSSLLRVAT